MKVSVIVPTLDISKAQKYVGESLKDCRVNITYVIDIYKNVSKTRNKGAEKEKDADVLFFIDDDMEIDPEHFRKWLGLILENRKNVIWSEPHRLIFGIARELFILIGGFDERLPLMSEDTEMWYTLKKLERAGVLRINIVEEGYVHHTTPKGFERKWLNEKHSVYTFLKHDRKRLLHALKRYQDGWKIFLMRYVWLVWAVWKLLFFKRTDCKF